ncbi:MAG: aminotransferase class V-fold PLP-dependent enzyme, partial [Bacteriovoracaceae bacterium]|nr:aminotransferase class V-fold PLP-dependent enzyme [Bacteriovoracaceae bacterium]
YNVNFLSTTSSDFRKSFLDEVRSQDYSMIFISQVFFNSGEVLDLDFIKEIVKHKNKDTILVVDGYHGFCAVPTDLSELEDDIFYMAGAYKYAQGGEGMCFMTIPKGCELRPINTGWFASFESLEAQTTEVDYAQNGWRFAGSTRDFTAHYRFNAVWDQFFADGHTIESIHEYIQGLQDSFLKAVNMPESFTNTNLVSQGHFLTIDCGSEAKAKSLYEMLKKDSILTDYRAQRLRFGFGLYLTKDQVQKACTSLNQNFNLI